MCEATGTAIGTVQVETEEVRVTRWDFPHKGANTGWHTHAYVYVGVPVVVGSLSITCRDGTGSVVPLMAGVSYAREAGVEHDVANGLDTPMAFVEIEMLKTG